jgi:RNA polymerase sigma factor (sigma-70 family)
MHDTVRMRDTVNVTFDAFCRREWVPLVASLSYLVGDRATGEDLAQEVLARAYQHWDSVALLESPGGWAHRVGVNLASSHRRQLRIRARHHASVLEMPSTDEPIDALEVRRAVSELPLTLRQAVVLRHVVGFSVEETAAVLGITPEAVRVRAHRGADRLRRRLR